MTDPGAHDTSDQSPARDAEKTDSAVRIEEALAQVLSMIATAERLSRDSQVVNLSSLDRRVSCLCGEIRALPPSQARHFAVGLTRLVAGLDRLEAVTRDAHAALHATHWDGDAALAEVASSTRASAAYARALAVTPTEPPGQVAPHGKDRRRVDRRHHERREGADRRRGARRGEESDTPSTGGSTEE